MSMDDTFSEHAPTISPQIRTLRLVEHVRPEQEQAYLEWSREFSDAHANFIATRDPESWSSVVMIRDRLCGNQMSRRISAHGPIMTSTPSTRRPRRCFASRTTKYSGRGRLPTSDGR